jgi:DNA repair protein RadC
MTLSELPSEERPRERLLKYGADMLSLTELLAILLVTGTKGKSVLDLAQEIIKKFGSLQGILEATVPELTEIKGIGHAKAIQLKAAFGIALKSARSLPAQITSESAYAFIKDEMENLKQEKLIVILKDVKGRLITHETVSLGTLSEVLVHPREIFYPAVRHKANSLILAHNHPSGDPTPSPADLRVTRALLQSSKIMGIGFDDHLIIGHGHFVSLKNSGFF